MSLKIKQELTKVSLRSEVIFEHSGSPRNNRSSLKNQQLYLIIIKVKSYYKCPENFLLKPQRGLKTIVSNSQEQEQQREALLDLVFTTGKKQIILIFLILLSGIFKATKLDFCQATFG